MEKENQNPNKAVKARVVTAWYGMNAKGDIVEVQQREIDRVSPVDPKTGKRIYESLIPLEEEARLAQEAAQPKAETDEEFGLRKESQQAWRDLERKSDSIMAKRRVEDAERLVNSVKKPAPAAAAAK